jgi:hypothetical protein
MAGGTLANAGALDCFVISPRHGAFVQVEADSLAIAWIDADCRGRKDELPAEIPPRGRGFAIERVGHRSGAEAEGQVALVLGKLALQQLLHVGLVGGGEPAALQEKVGQRGVLPASPGKAGGGKMVGLQRQHAEEEVAVGVHHGVASLVATSLAPASPLWRGKRCTGGSFWPSPVARTRKVGCRVESAAP